MPLPQRFGILGTKLNVLGSSISRVGRTWFGGLIDAGTLGHVFYEEVQYEAQVFIWSIRHRRRMLINWVFKDWQDLSRGELSVGGPGTLWERPGQEKGGRNVCRHWSNRQYG
jgi:hypothetical protein